MSCVAQSIKSLWPEVTTLYMLMHDEPPTTDTILGPMALSHPIIQVTQNKMHIPHREK